MPVCQGWCLCQLTTAVPCANKRYCQHDCANKQASQGKLTQSKEGGLQDPPHQIPGRQSTWSASAGPVPCSPASRCCPTHRVAATAAMTRTRCKAQGVRDPHPRVMGRCLERLRRRTLGMLGTAWFCRCLRACCLLTSTFQDVAVTHRSTTRRSRRHILILIIINKIN